MTVVTDVRSPRLEVVEGESAVYMHLGDHRLLLSTVEECRDLIHSVGRALWYLDERERLIESRKDRDAAEFVNRDHAAANRRDGYFPPVFQRPAPTPTVVLDPEVA